MHPDRLISLVGFALAAALMGSCGAAGEFVVIPPQVEKAQAPKSMEEGVHAVYLYDVKNVHFDPIDIGTTYWPAYATTQYTKIKLLTRAATHDFYGTIFIYHYGDLFKIEAKIIKPDGTVRNLTKNDFTKTVLVKDVVPEVTPPIDYCRTGIVWPGLDPGDIIQYEYTKRGVGREAKWRFNRLDAPVLFSKFMLARPIQRSEILPVISNPHNLDIEKTVDKGMATGMAGYLSVSRQSTYDIWTARNVPPIFWETGMPPLNDISSGVGVWQGDRKWDWNTMGTTYYKWFTHYGRYPGKATELAKEVTKGIEDRIERAKAIYKWIKNTFNIVDIDSLSYVPRAIEIETIDVDDMLEEKDVPPEKLASLMWLMLKAVDVDATLVLATHEDDPRALEDLPELYQFSYPLLALDNKTFMDTTNRLVPFGMVPWFFEGRKALWIKEGSVSFGNIPLSSPADNKREIKVKGSVEPDGTAKVDAEFTFHGQMAYAWRKWMAPQKPHEREDSVRQVAMASAEKAEVDNFELINVDDVEKPLELKVKYQVPGHAEVMQDKMIFKMGPFIHLGTCPSHLHSSGNWYYACPTPTSDIRKNPVKFPFRQIDDMNITVDFPKGFLLQALPKGFRTKQIEKGTTLGVQTSYGSDGGKNIIVLRKYSVNETDVAKPGLPTLRKMLRRYIAQKDTLVTLEIPKLTD